MLSRARKCLHTSHQISKVVAAQSQSGHPLLHATSVLGFLQ